MEGGGGEAARPGLDSGSAGRRPDVGDGAEARHALDHFIMRGVRRHIFCRRHRQPATQPASQSVSQSVSKSVVRSRQTRTRWSESVRDSRDSSEHARNAGMARTYVNCSSFAVVVYGDGKNPPDFVDSLMSPEQGTDENANTRSSVYHVARVPQLKNISALAACFSDA
jgi:hypothetical protein